MYRSKLKQIAAEKRVGVESDSFLFASMWLGYVDIRLLPLMSSIGDLLEPRHTDSIARIHRRK